MLFLMMLIDSEEDRSKFEILYEQYRRYMFRIAMQILGNAQDAEDAVHEAFIKIIKNLDKISDPKCPQTKHFIVIIVRRTAIDMMRQKSREPETVTIDDETEGVLMDGNETDVYRTADERLVLAEAMAKLPDTYRDVILLKYYHDFSDEMIADQMGMSVANVQKTIQRARKKLELELG
jgi:RNA polymerase sigma-70 factor (ECF subfamily)